MSGAATPVIRPATAADRAELVRMWVLLYGGSEHDLEREIDAHLAGGRDGFAVLVVERDGGGLMGFVELGERAYAEGCESSPVAYVEGWFVDEDVRRRGVGRALFAAAERWARERGHREMASDALIENETSILAHRALGFSEVERIVCFRRSLAD